MTRVERISRLDSRLTGRSRTGFRERVRALRYDRHGLEAMLDAVEQRLQLLAEPQRRLPPPKPTQVNWRQRTPRVRSWPGTA